MTALDTMTVEERLDRVKAIMVAIETQAVASDDYPGRGGVCATLGIMGADEMAKVRAVLDVEGSTAIADRRHHDHCGPPHRRVTPHQAPLIGAFFLRD